MHGRFFNQTIAVVVVVVVVAVAAAWMFWPKAADRGRSRFFADQTYNFQTLRALDDVSDIGGDTGETLQTVGGLKSGDAQGWYDAWQTTGDRVVMTRLAGDERYCALMPTIVRRSSFSHLMTRNGLRSGRRTSMPFTRASTFSASSTNGLPCLTASITSTLSTIQDR
jgi:hypothetical protein